MTTFKKGMPAVPATPEPVSPVTRLPSVTVVVATRDRLPLLRRALAAILDQSYRGYVEVIVVFDQSDPVDLNIQPGPDRGLKIVRNARTPGLAGSRNTGITAASGDYVAFCDDDDEWLPGKLAAQIDLLTARGGVAAGTGIVIRSGDSARLRPGPERPVTFRDLLRDRTFTLNGSNLIIDRTVLTGSVGLVDEELPGSYAEDYDLLLRIAKVAPILSVTEPLVAINWSGSFFARRFPMIADALTHLLAKHPEFAGEPHGLARIEGQIAFYLAAGGRRGAALGWARRALRHNWREPRAYLALPVIARLATGQRILALLNARGRGI